ncbi:intron-binding protein aquarius, partial [Haematococcus lacustris]
MLEVTDRPEQPGEGALPPSKKLRPSSLEDVVVRSEDAAQHGGVGIKSAGYTLTMREIKSDKLTSTAAANWSTAARQAQPPPAFDPSLVQSIYLTELGGGSEQPAALKRVMLLEVSQYLENYLWPHFEAGAASFEHVMSIILM